MKNIITRYLKEFASIAATYGLDLLSSLLISLILPVFVSIDCYANIKTYLMYVVYVSLVNFGFNDGMYIKYGKYDYNQLPYGEFKRYLYHISVVELPFIILLIFAGTIFPNIIGTKMAVILSVNILFVNTNGFFNFINQFTKRFSLNLKNSIVSKIIQFVIILILIIKGIDNWILYVLTMTICTAINCMLNMWRNLNILRAPIKPYIQAKNNIFDCYKAGISVMVGYYAVQLITTASQFSIRYTASTEIFAYYSFAFSIMNFINVFVNSTSTCLYPNVKRLGETRRQDAFEIVAVAGIFLTSICFLFIPLIDYLITILIPKYADATKYIRILFPIVLTNGISKAVASNIYKVYRLEIQYMRRTVVTAVFAIILVALAVVLTSNSYILACIAVLNTFVNMIIMLHGIRRYLHQTGLKLIVVYSLVILITYYIALVIYENLFSYLMFFIVIVILGCIGLIRERRLLIKGD